MVNRYSMPGPTSGTSPDHVATLFAFWCLPQIFFYGLHVMLGQVLNTRGRFGSRTRITSMQTATAMKAASVPATGREIPQERRATR